MFMLPAQQMLSSVSSAFILEALIKSVSGYNYVSYLSDSRASLGVSGEVSYWVTALSALLFAIHFHRVFFFIFPSFLLVAF